MSAPDPFDPLSSQIRADVTPERELGLRRVLRRNKEQLFETLDAPPAPLRARTPYALGVSLGAMAAAALVGSLWMHARPGLTAAPRAITAALDVAEPSGPAAFDRHVSHAGERLALREGTLALRTRGFGPKLRVLVPDGELEDVGTEFRVTVANGRTQSIEVTDGLVVFHRHDGEDIRLPAGSIWNAPAAVGARSPKSDNPAAPSSGSMRLPRALASAPRATPAAEENGEDMAYLHILSLIRENRREEARVASQEYLRRFPNGFRRVEIEQLAR